MERNKYAIVTPSQRPEDVNKHAAKASCLRFIFSSLRALFFPLIQKDNQLL